MGSDSRWSKLTTRKRLFQLHGWFGMNFGLLLTWVCLSGAVATLTYEIEWLTQPSLRIEPRGQINWQATYEALRSAYPDHQIGGFSRGEPSVMENLAWTSYITAPDGDWQQVRVDPYVARIVKSPTQLYLTDVMRQLHYNFFSNLGFYLVSFIAFPLILSIITALLFLKRWWTYLFRLRFGRGAHALISSLHRVIGVWTLIFGVIIGITGVWYLIEKDVVPRAVVYPSDPKVSAEKMEAHGPVPRLLKLERYIEAAQDAFPELEPTGISLPGAPDGVVRVEGRTGRLLVRDRANAVFLDPYDATVVQVRNSARDGPMSWWVNAADSLHFGYWGGLASKILWAVFGLCLPAMVLTGAYLSWRRAGIIGATRSQRGQSSRGVLSWLRRRPMRTWIMLPLMAVIISWGIIGYERRAEAPAPFIEVGEVSIGPWRARIIRKPGASEDEAVRYAVAFDAAEGERVNLRRATLGLHEDGGTEAKPAAQATDLNGAAHSMRGGLPVPVHLRGDTALRLDAETWNGDTFHATFRDTRPHQAPDTAPRYTPSAPRVFYSIILGYALLSLLVAGTWFFLDIVPSASDRRDRRSVDRSPQHTVSKPSRSLFGLAEASSRNTVDKGLKKGE